MICLVTVSRLVLVRTTNSRSNKFKSITRLELNTVRRFLLLHNNMDYARLKESALPSSIISGLSEAGPLDSRGLNHFRDGEEERERDEPEAKGDGFSSSPLVSCESLP